MTTNDISLDSREVLSFYSDNGLNVETDDQRTPVFAGEIDFYVHRAIESGGPVLELGCGTGRVSWPIARAGVSIVGLDRSQGMLNVAERKRVGETKDASSRVRFVSGDMSDFELGETFSLAIIPFRAFLMLTSPAAQRGALACIRRHLKPGGRLIVDVFDPKLDMLVPEATRWRQDIADVQLDSGNVVSVEVLERKNDVVQQTLAERWRFTETTPSGEIVREEIEQLRLRWSYRYEMRYLLELAGFAVEEEMSDYFGAAPAYAKEQIWVAQRP
jgi:ubiquinone/menaquinone biosynthesis C-methylase UbiE